MQVYGRHRRASGVSCDSRINNDRVWKTSSPCEPEMEYLPVIKVADENAPEHALRTGFSPAFALESDQGAKSDFQKQKYYLLP